MCKIADNSGVCTELGTDTALWSVNTPLPKPEWMRISLHSFQAALGFQLSGNRTKAIQETEKIEDERLRNWFAIHAQNVGNIRFLGLGSKKVASDVAILDSSSKFAKFTKEVFASDSYTCVYCNWPVFPKEVFVSLAPFLETGNFFLGRSNATRPGMYLTFCGTLDHVTPFKRGGLTDPTNLVTCCWPCNYGKAEYFLEEIGLDPVNIFWAITSESLARLSSSKTWKIFNQNPEVNFTPEGIYGSDGKLRQFSGRKWEKQEDMRSDLMSNMGGGVPIAVIDTLVKSSRVVTR